jgi:hypothetical protein
MSARLVCIGNFTLGQGLGFHLQIDFCVNIGRISLLKRWPLMGTHQGAVSRKHLDYYLDEFTFRFNRRRSRNRGKLFFRLVQQAVAVEPVSLDRILHPEARPKKKPQSVGAT